MKSEHPDLPLTIAALARSGTAVRPLRTPSVRLARWALMSAGLGAVSLVLFGVRADAMAQAGNGWFMARAAATLAVAIGAATVAMLMSVPGIEPSRVTRALPMAACLAWAAMLIVPIATSESPVEVLRQVAVHPSCVLFIAATALPAWAVLVRMLRRAAPLHVRWTAGLVGLASLAAGALTAQFVCSDDRAAHHLLWHFTPVVGLAVASVVAGSSLLAWPPRQAS